MAIASLVHLRPRRPWESYVVVVTVSMGAALVPMAVAACAIVVTLAIIIALKRSSPDDAIPTARTRR